MHCIGIGYCWQCMCVFVFQQSVTDQSQNTVCFWHFSQFGKSPVTDQIWWTDLRLQSAPGQTFRYESKCHNIEDAPSQSLCPNISFRYFCLVLTFYHVLFFSQDITDKHSQLQSSYETLSYNNRQLQSEVKKLKDKTGGENWQYMSALYLFTWCNWQGLLLQVSPVWYWMTW